MWVCQQHIRRGLALMAAPHIRKAPSGISCSFCEQKAELNMYYAHEPSKRKQLFRTSGHQVHPSAQRAI